MSPHGAEVSRRNFVTALLAAGVSLRLDARIGADDAELTAIEQTMHAFVVERMLDSDGLCRSMFCMATLAPWTNADLAKVDQWRITEWRHAYRHRTIVTAGTHPHALGLYVGLAVLAAKASGDNRYLAQMASFDDAMNAAVTDPALNTFNSTSLMAEGYHVAMQAGSPDPRLPQTIGWLWQIGAKCIDENGHGFIIRKVPEFDPQGTRLAAIATLADALRPSTHATDLARKILLANRDPARMSHTGDMSASLCEVSITSWLLAYWRLREGVTP